MECRAGPIFALLIDHGGRLWIASSAAVWVIDNPGGSPFRVRTYNTANGLASNTILCMAEDELGRIYAGTGKGVDRLDPATGRIKHFSAADGLAHGELRSAFRDRSGNLWFATTQGLSRLTPGADRPPARPTVLITDLQISGECYPVFASRRSAHPAPELDPSRNQLQVTFVGFNDEPEENLATHYKLEGTDRAGRNRAEHGQLRRRWSRATTLSGEGRELGRPGERDSRGNRFRGSAAVLEALVV